jgi:hypothetical protein
MIDKSTKKEIDRYNETIRKANEMKHGASKRLMDLIGPYIYTEVENLDPDFLEWLDDQLEDGIVSFEIRLRLRKYRQAYGA